MASKSQEIEAKVEALVKKMRAFFAQSPMPSISTLQRNSLRERSGLQSTWLSQTTLSSPENTIRTVLYEAIRSISKDGWTVFKLHDIVPIDVEWIGYRKDSLHVGDNIGLSEREKYLRLMNDVSSDITIFYVHGGGFYRGDPSNFRRHLCKLAQMTRGRCVSVRYRLAPQHPFPAALLDVLTTYLSLLYPPPDSFHEAIPASNIILAGDSAGANLCLALVQVILHLHWQHGSGYSFQFFGKDVTVPCPAGVAAFSAWTECTNSLPSFTANAHRDYFSTTTALERVPPCEIWPTDPPRGAIYCDISALCHPLISPTIAESWAGAPPLWFCCGEEMAADNSKVIAQHAVGQGCTVLWAQYDVMPHCFPFLFDLPQTDHSFTRWARFCRACVEDPGSVASEGLRIGTSLEVYPVQIRNLMRLSFVDVKNSMRRGMTNMAERYQGKANAEAKL